MALWWQCVETCTSKEEDQECQRDNKEVWRTIQESSKLIWSANEVQWWHQAITWELGNHQESQL